VLRFGHVGPKTSLLGRKPGLNQARAENLKKSPLEFSILGLKP